ncbi:hypothetical protein [Shewanella surugensis]|uniref:Uncharacterized protein n=1 Tax=Shewanella surugensis TaxID=212020 RepID=A0ABT0LEL7_9GAMM|nr:hypothetical protein [Shewanella surugensis]MCL1125601.1 hypothetical protein [Shewanella surugensis]
MLKAKLVSKIEIETETADKELKGIVTKVGLVEPGVEQKGMAMRYS